MIIFVKNKFFKLLYKKIDVIFFCKNTLKYKKLF